jgi:hypothetical protein
MARAAPLWCAPPSGAPSAAQKPPHWQPLTSPLQTWKSGVKHVPEQHGNAPLHASASPAHAGAPQVPLGALGEDRTQTVPEQQSESAVQSPLGAWQGATQVPDPRSQVEEQHWPFEVQESPFETQLTHSSGAPLQSVLQQSPAPEQLVPAAPHAPPGTAHLNSAPSKRHEFGAQHSVLSAPEHVAPVTMQLGAAAVQRRTPSAPGTHGAPLQHWSRNWQTFAVPVPGWMQQAGSFASYPVGHAPQLSPGQPPKQR